MTFEELVHSVFNTEEGKELITQLVEREILPQFDYSNPSLLAAQAARKEFVLGLIQAAGRDIAAYKERRKVSQAKNTQQPDFS